jgi:hypothetical protein
MTSGDLLDAAAGDDRPRPILLGEAPSKGGDRYHSFPLSGRPARVLCELAGIPPQPGGSTYGRWTWALYERFNCCNIIDRYADAVPWSASRARDRARALLNDLEARQIIAEFVSPGTGNVQEETYRHLTGARTVKRMTVEPFPVIVCLGRKVQSAVFRAIDGDIGRAPLATPGAWGGNFFGNYGVWSHPWNHRVPIARRVCNYCGVPESHEGPCFTGYTHKFVPAGEPEQRWAPHVVTIPHPSGLNRLLNDEATRGRCGDVLRRALKLAGDANTVTA